MEQRYLKLKAGARGLVTGPGHGQGLAQPRIQSGLGSGGKDWARRNQIPNDGAEGKILGRAQGWQATRSGMDP